VVLLSAPSPLFLVLSVKPTLHYRRLSQNEQQRLQKRLQCSRPIGVLLHSGLVSEKGHTEVFK